jgi:hypothetical protein
MDERGMEGWYGFESHIRLVTGESCPERIPT